MRVTTAYSYSASMANLQKRQTELNEANGRMTSGKRVEKASDDPTNAARAERALAVVARSDANQRALEASRNAMTLTENALGDATELLQQAREAMVAAGNGSYSDAERAAQAKKLTELRQQLFTVANRSDGAGGFLFSGQGASQPPFVDTATGVQFRGAAGQVDVASDEALPLTIDGADAWLHAPTGNGVFETRATSSTTAWIDAGRVSDPSQLTGGSYNVQFTQAGGITSYEVRNAGGTLLASAPYKEGKAIEVEGMSFNIGGAPAVGDRFDIVPSTRTQDVFGVLDRTIAELTTPHRTGAQITQSAQTALRDLDAVGGALQDLRAAVGESLNRADAVEGRVSALRLYGETARSNAEDLDLAQAISDFKNKETGYSASLQTYSSVQRLSLFQYIS
ncbi:MAG: flagellar hook-associated protein FlgL [Aquincola tertiaricarbonis]|uniref:flagellar hook-associated protein FlgL n=1 Tax=Aquincola sp. J276 TaxID=2898432 RepID=UPI0021519FD0|nr:flagellar hook-associated protein FlgL [Aquincola sp. J276]MCR5868973.1 flagellar hook-associated protein FlgL [Aquincola sp. J276]